MNVHNNLGRGFREYVYCRALAIELGNVGISFDREVWLPIHYKSFRIAYRRCDFLCEEKVIVEIKAKDSLTDGDLVQAINTVERLNHRDGLLLNFGAKSLEQRHIFNNKVRPENEFTDITAELVGETGEDIFESRHYLPEWEIERLQRAKLKKR